MKKNSTTDSRDHSLAQIRDLKRVRLIASLAATVELAKLLPAIDGLVLLVEWAVLKTALPGMLEVKDALSEGVRNPLSLMRAFAAGNWIALLHRAFGGAQASAVLALDVLTDAETLVMPAPFDGFDIPSPLADAAIAALAHRSLKSKIRDAQVHTLPMLEEHQSVSSDIVEMPARDYKRVA